MITPPSPSLITEISTYTPVLIGASGVGYAGYALIRSVYRRTVRDGLEVAKDRGETDLVQKLMDLNSTLTAANTGLRTDNERLVKERGETLARSGKLESDVEHIRERLGEAHTEIALLRRQVGLNLTQGGRDEHS